MGLAAVLVLAVEAEPIAVLAPGDVVDLVLAVEAVASSGALALRAAVAHCYPAAASGRPSELPPSGDAVDARRVE